MAILKIYTDGACSGNQNRENIGGWGAILEYGSHKKELYGGELNTTNNRMEMTALLKAFEALIARGHTILIIEHNMEVIKCADHVIDLGPDGGDKGGNLVIAGTPEQVVACKESLTGKYLKEKLG